MSYMTKVDNCISQIPINRDTKVPKARILYFYAEDREIIWRALKDGHRLWDMIAALPGVETMTGETFDADASDRIGELTKHHAIMALLDYLNLDADEKPKNAPLCLYLTDFHIFADKNKRSTGQKTADECVKTFLDDPLLAKSILLLSSPFKCIPDGFESCIHLINVSKLDGEDIAKLIFDLQKNDISPEQREAVLKIADQYRGLSQDQIEAILFKLNAEYGAACDVFADDTCKEDCRRKTIAFIHDAKEEISSKQLAISFLDTSSNAKAIGMSTYEGWLKKTKNSFINNKPNAPYGVVLIGVPGTGKSLMARRTAQEYNNCPLIEFDLGMCKDQYVGNSYKKLEKYLKLFEDIAPVVILLNEAEKYMDNSKDRSGVTSELIGKLLVWMEKRPANVFMFFTSNDISKINPETFRKGRTNMICFAGMPWGEELALILQSNLIHEHQQWKNYDQSGILDDALIADLKKHDQANTVSAYCTDIINTFADAAETPPKRDLLFTGADLSQLINDTITELEVTKNKPFDAEEFKSTMLDLVKGPFRPTGESNMDGIIKLYYLSAKNNYLPVSPHQELEDLIRSNEDTLPEKNFVKYDKVLYERIGNRLLAAKKYPK